MAKVQKDTRNPEPNEMVGSKDLREAFKDGNIKGSWSINGIELHQFNANSPASVVSQINGKTGAHFVTAEIDDGGHLVLIDYSGGDIVVTQGAAYVDPTPLSTGDAAKDAVNALKNAAKDSDKKKDGDGNKVLEQLGLKATTPKENAAAQQPGYETGRSAEDRKKAAEYAKQHPEAITANPNQPAMSGVDKSFAPQIASNPTPGALSGAGGKLDDGRGRTGTGGGQGETSAKTVQDQHSGASAKPAPVPGA
jgi:hypothetical protein